MKRRRSRSVIPGFGLSLGITVTILSLIVLIPLCSLVVFSAGLSPADFIKTVTGARVRSSYFVSISTALAASLINAVMGLILAWVLVQYEFPGKRLIDGIIELPFALPTAVAGISLTHLTTVNGWVGHIFFNLFGIKIAYTRIGITTALVFIGIPFVVRAVQPVLELFKTTFGMDVTGFTLAFARSIGEYGSVVFIAGNTPYKTEIAPLMIMAQLQEYDYASATSIALVMLAIAFIILFVNAVLQSAVSKRISGIA